MTLLMTAVGLGLSTMILSSFDETWTISVPVAVLTLVGGSLVAAATYLSGVPTRLAGVAADFWGGGQSTALLTAASFSASAALLWGLAMIALFETRLPR